MFSELQVELWCMLNILCMFKYTGILSNERIKCEAHLALKILAIFTVLSTV